eukprot:CAMPEP_0177608894 /NCGR_PEP_ID=MMETSP0419_2-20121207/18738_1 /TAXON_ID=582737 /ORGANISM="Tetraselmis sp., Strain GSL018" /LENGTH=43 /DNA_ID= /DNA_START= /DNA_END= /DNA_ORIENTATION=
MAEEKSPKDHISPSETELAPTRWEKFKSHAKEFVEASPEEHKQ